MLPKITLATEIAAAIFGCIYFYKYGNTPLKLWLILLFLAPSVEIIGDWYTNNVTYNNHVVFNIYDVIGELILFKMVYDHILDKQRKRAIIWLVALSILSLVVNCLYANFITDFLLVYKTTTTIIIIITLALYLIDILKSNQLITFKKNLAFIVFSGYLIFNVVYLPIYITFRYILDYTNNSAETIYPVLHALLDCTVVFVNLLFIFGLVWTRKSDPKFLIS